MINEKIQIVKDAVKSYVPAIRGKGRMTGKRFTRECRKVWSESNEINAEYYKLFEQFIVSIEARHDGFVNIRVATRIHVGRPKDVEAIGFIVR